MSTFSLLQYLLELASYPKITLKAYIGSAELEQGNFQLLKKINPERVIQFFQFAVKFMTVNMFPLRINDSIATLVFGETPTHIC